ncbi:MAG TPA: LuxR C-terminal-related transcriptional regulator, partial [Chitinophagaceae bacterium]|nr:LuxR C-terminal-related transcriptional regulator [Chitinophagaceae bacterium]
SAARTAGRFGNQEIQNIIDEADTASEKIQSVLHDSLVESLFYDAKRIAELVGISTLTVCKHISNIYTKLHVNSRAQVITMAHKNNWLS